MKQYVEKYKGVTYKAFDAIEMKTQVCMHACMHELIHACVNECMDQ